MFFFFFFFFFARKKEWCVYLNTGISCFFFLRRIYLYLTIFRLKAYLCKLYKFIQRILRMCSNTFSRNLMNGESHVIFYIIYVTMYAFFSTCQNALNICIYSQENTQITVGFRFTLIIEARGGCLCPYFHPRYFLRLLPFLEPFFGFRSSRATWLHREAARAALRYLTDGQRYL